MTLAAHYTGNFIFAGLLGMPKTLTFETANVVRTTENRAGEIFNFQLAIHFIQNNLPNVFRNNSSGSVHVSFLLTRIHLEHTKSVGIDKVLNGTISSWLADFFIDRLFGIILSQSHNVNQLSVNTSR